MKKETISTQDAKAKISIVDYLARHGHKPVGTSGKRHKYFSVFRKEKDPSLFVDDETGVWNDFGQGGGSIIDLAKQMHGFPDVETTLEHLALFVGTIISERHVPVQQINALQRNPNPSITNIQVRPLNHFVLLKYLRETRGISDGIAQKYLKLVWYDNKDRKGLFAIGWKNDSGDWELRGAGKTDFKAVTGTKDTTTIPARYPSEKLYLFEGMLDFLSALMIKRTSYLEGTTVILNSTSMIKKAIGYIKENKPESIYTFFDNDSGGEEALRTLKEEVIDLKILNQTFYENFKDVNDYWVARLKKHQQ